MWRGSGTGLPVWWDKGSGYTFVINILCFEEGFKDLEKKGKIVRCHLIIIWNSSHVLGTVCVLATHPSRSDTATTEGCPGGHPALTADVACVSWLPDTVQHVACINSGKVFNLCG